jgi:hypothetical protein
LLSPGQSIPDRLLEVDGSRADVSVLATLAGLHGGRAGATQAMIFSIRREEAMKKKWTKPTVCQVPAGMEISRYQSAEIARK